MNLSEFARIDAQFRSRNPKIIGSIDYDGPASAEQVTAAEEMLEAKLPKSYREFLQEFGSGLYAFAVVFSLAPDNHWNLFKHFALAKKYGIPSNLLPFSDDECGGYYAFMKSGDEFLEPVHYWHFEDGAKLTRYSSLFDFVADHGLRAHPGGA